METPREQHRRFFKTYVRPRFRQMVVLIVLSIIGELFMVIIPVIFGLGLVDKAITEKETGLLAPIIVSLLAIYIAMSISLYLSTYLSGKLGARVSNDIRQGIFGTLQYKTLKKLYEVKSGDILSRIMNDVQLTQQMFTLYPIQIFGASIGIFLPLLIMLSIRWDLALICIAPTLLYIPVSLLFGRALRTRQKAALEDRGKVSTTLKEAVSVFPLTKTFELEGYQRDRFGKDVDRYYRSQVGVSKTGALYTAIVSVTMFLPIFLLILFGSGMVIEEVITIGVLFAFATYTLQFYGPVTTLAGLWTSLKSAEAAFDRVWGLLEMEEEEGGEEELMVKPEKINFREVSFSYDTPVFKSLSFSLRRGINFLIGDNGTGKTTVLNLIARLYTPDEGEVKIDGQDVSQVKLASLRKNISFLAQEVQLLDTSIYENILLGNLEAKEEEVINAAKLARAHDFISKLPDGYDSRVGEEGLKLSGGEKQKIALARAVLKGAPIMLLDEVTSSVDTESRSSIYATLRDLERDRIIVIATHDYSEIGKKDLIIDLNELRNRQ
jgi:ATP-binding cassette subfamily B protein/subfamily B ATP-binding cassette protein MsbA